MIQTGIEIANVIDSLPGQPEINKFSRLLAIINTINGNASILQLESIVKIVKEDFLNDKEKDY